LFDGRLFNGWLFGDRLFGCGLFVLEVCDLEDATGEAESS
jgi:hypothetical protein